MKENDLKVGGVYEFKTCARRILSFDDGKLVRNAYVVWEYADGLPRQGRLGGRTWKSSFAAKAKVKSDGKCVCYWFSAAEREDILNAARTLGVDEQDFVKRSVLRAAKKVNEFLDIR